MEYVFRAVLLNTIRNLLFGFWREIEMLIFGVTGRMKTHILLDTSKETDVKINAIKT
jgi:hypothetical protein